MYGKGAWGFCETWKELHKIICRFCKKLMGIPSFVANAFTEMETVTESRGSKYVGQIVMFWYQIMCLDINDTAKECYKWQRSNTSVQSWNMELKEELNNSGSAFVWRMQ
jgi:hypothetical protein